MDYNVFLYPRSGAWVIAVKCTSVGLRISQSHENIIFNVTHPSVSLRNPKCLVVLQRWEIKVLFSLSYILSRKQSVTAHIPEYCYSAHHDSSSLLVESHSNVLYTWWLYPVSCACCNSYSPLTAGMLVLCDKLYGASSTLGDWCCVLKLKEKSVIFQSWQTSNSIVNTLDLNYLLNKK